jgi:excisionase family DNA binding protein
MVAPRDPITPTKKEAELARESNRRLAPYKRRDLRLRLAGARRSDESIVLPAAAVRLLVDALAEMAAGNAVALVPTRAELTTQRAADMLGVSRPFLIKEVSQGKLPCRKVGSHRRILFSDLLEYRRRMDDQRLKALEELAAQAQELGIGY